MQASLLLETDRAERETQELFSNYEKQLYSVSYSVPQIWEPHMGKLIPLTGKLLQKAKTPLPHLSPPTTPPER